MQRFRMTEKIVLMKLEKRRMVYMDAN